MVFCCATGDMALSKFARAQRREGLEKYTEENLASSPQSEVHYIVLAGLASPIIPHCDCS